MKTHVVVRKMDGRDSEKELGHRIRKSRKALGLTIEDFAELIDKIPICTVLLFIRHQTLDSKGFLPKALWKLRIPKSQKPLSYANAMP